MKLKTRRRLFAAAIVLVLLAGVGFLFKGQVRSAYEAIIGNDYGGPGSGSVTIEIGNGDSGTKIIDELVALGVVKSARFTMRLATDENIVFFPGTFQLKKQMRSIDALQFLGNAKNAMTHHVTIKEGLRLQNVFKTLSKATGISVEDFISAAKNLGDFKVGSGAPSLEGYLFPATYNFGPELTAKQILVRMNDRMVEELDGFGVKQADWHHVLTLAGLIQAEARRTEDFYKVSRVFLNRIDQGMKLQSDATVSYGVNGTTVNTTAAERADQNGYNTYVHAGLPIGPISAPGHLAIDAALHPAKGTWIYFCAVNLETGETWFSTTYAEHAKAVAAWRAWMKDHPGYE
jgi:UPF0755 protein